MLRSRTTEGVKAAHRIKHWNIAVGDSVRVITGPQKGVVGKVVECLKKENRLVVSGVNVIRKMLPLYIAQKSGLETQKFEYAAPIHYSNVQLVGDIPTAANPLGPKRRVEIKRVNRGRTFFNRDKKLLTWRRWVPGENVFLPWPRNDRSKKVDGPMDTQEEDLLAYTYLESLHASPVPPGIEDELRNKYSKFRRGDRKERALAVSEVDGLEALDAAAASEKNFEQDSTTDDVSIAKTTADRQSISSRSSRHLGPTASLKPDTIKLLATALSSRQGQPQSSSSSLSSPSTKA